MLLNSIEELRARLNVEDRPKINTALKDILVDVALAFENHLGTSFGREQKVDKFYLDPSNYLTNAHVVHLRLSGFNPSAVSVTLRGSTLSNNYPVDARYLKLDPNAALLSVCEFWRKGDYLDVAYSSGFDLLDDNQTYTGVPMALQRASLMFAENVFMTKYGDNKPATTEDYTQPPEGVIQLLSKFDRYAPHCLRPL